MVVGLIQLAHKMSRVPPPARTAPCPPGFLCHSLLCSSVYLLLCSPCSLFSPLSLPLSVYFRSQMWHGLNLGFTSASHSFVCCCSTPLAIVLFIMYLFHFYILTFSFFLSASLLLSLVAPLSRQQQQEEEEELK